MRARFTAISLQALPFLVFGVALSAAITALVPQVCDHSAPGARGPAAGSPVRCSRVRMRVGAGHGG